MRGQSARGVFSAASARRAAAHAPPATCSPSSPSSSARRCASRTASAAASRLSSAASSSRAYRSSRAACSSSVSATCRAGGWGGGRLRVAPRRGKTAGAPGTAAHQQRQQQPPPHLDEKVGKAVPLGGGELAPRKVAPVHQREALVCGLECRKLDGHHALGVGLVHLELQVCMSACVCARACGGEGGVRERTRPGPLGCSCHPCPHDHSTSHTLSMRPSLPHSARRSASSSSL